jgi:DNA modification methylase
VSDPRVIHGDCLSVLPALPDASVDAVVTDPPAGIAFMGKEWDDFRRARNEADAGRDDVFGRTSRTGPEYGRRERTAFIDFLTAALSECLRVTKPGGRLLCWAIPRTSHWTGTAIEDAGWVIEDRIAHLFGQGFPKAKSRLKPACEDWWLARKPSRTVPPLPGLDACRIPTEESLAGGAFSGPRIDAMSGDKRAGKSLGMFQPGAKPNRSFVQPVGRWPANVTMDEDAAAALDEMSGERPAGIAVRRNGVTNAIAYGGNIGRLPPGTPDMGYGDTGGASRFFYCAKAPKSDRGDGNKHPTVKNTNLMRWLCRLITPPGGVILDPCMGSGSTGKAAVIEGFGFIGIEQDAEHVAVAERRINEAQAERSEMLIPA